ncbi:MAG: TetR/AcrR family transcriptional regulator [Candidatus Saccharibacteria bacterium]|nr:TetR/AcrR family transcriptional regulator [Candidatus Saccharibacteria bacterium]
MTIIIVKDLHVSSTAKDEMIEGALKLLAMNGLQATSFSDVLELTGAPRGSIYHHFPKGKEQLISAALKLSETRTNEAIGKLAGKNATEITEGFLELWRQLLIRSQFTAGCSAVAVTVATDSKDLLDSATSIFRSWQNTLTELFKSAGLSHQSATQFATTLIAASEGAVVMSRAEKSIEPFESVASYLVQQASAK